MAKRKLQIPLSVMLCRLISPSAAPTFSTVSFGFQPSSIFSPQSSTHFSICRYELLLKSSLFLNRFASVAGSGLDFKCWNCDHAAESSPFLFCESCRSVQPVDHSVDYFEIFGLEKDYEIEFGSLEAKYKDWQKKLHPDLVHSKSQREKDYAAEQSARLKLKGLDAEEEQTISEPVLLGEIMEIREAVEEAVDSQALTEIQTQMQGKMKYWAKCFARAIQHQNFEEAKASIQRMTYYDRVNKEIVKRL